MSITRSRAESATTTAVERAPRRQARPGAPTELHPLGLRVVDLQALQAGIALATQELERNAADAYLKIQKPPAFDKQLGRMFAAENQIGHLIAANLKRLQESTPEISASRLMKTLLEAERERRQRHAVIANSCKEMVEGLRIKTSGLARVAEASTASLRRMAEDCTPRLASLDIALGIDAISALGTVGNFARLADLHDPMRIHAVPLLAPPPSRRQKADPECASIPSPQQAPERTPGLLDAGRESNDSQKLLKELIRFQQSDEIPSDAREGINVLNTWWKLNRLRITPDQSLEFNKVVQSFIGAQLDITTAPEVDQQLKSGLLVPHIHRPLPASCLAPDVYTTQKLKDQLHVSTDTLKRWARKACKRGPLPQPLHDSPDWFVVEESDPQGGQNRGYKFQERRKPEDS